MPLSAERACTVALGQEALCTNYKCWEMEASPKEKLGSPLLLVRGRYLELNHWGPLEM